MKFGVMSGGFGYAFRSGDMTFKDFLDYCADLKFDGIEPNDRVLGQLDILKLSKWLKELNLKIATIDITRPNFADPNRNRRLQAVESASARAIGC